MGVFTFFKLYKWYQIAQNVPYNENIGLKMSWNVTVICDKWTEQEKFGFQKVWISESNLADFTKQKLALFHVRDVEGIKRKI